MTDGREWNVEGNQRACITAARERLSRAVAGVAFGPVGYLGGGDFIVHMTGIDPQIDRVVRMSEAIEDGE